MLIEFADRLENFDGKLVLYTRSSIDSAAIAGWFCSVSFWSFQEFCGLYPVARRPWPNQFRSFAAHSLLQTCRVRYGTKALRVVGLFNMARQLQWYLIVSTVRVRSQLPMGNRPDYKSVSQRAAFSVRIIGIGNEIAYRTRAVLF